jgi:lipopolysaccharide biosynthesis protein
MPRVSRARMRTVMSHVRASVRRRARRAVLAVIPSAFSARTGSPADFSAWVERWDAGQRSGFPDSWTIRTDLPTETVARVGVVVHVYYPELLDEILLQLAAIPVTFDLIVTNASGEAITVDPGPLPRLSRVVILDVENHGRDILPLVQVVNAGLLDPYQVVLKVHTKRSEWRAGHHELSGTGEDWRGRLLNSLLGNVVNATSILNAFATSSRLGLVTADGSVLGPEFWGDNQAVTATLLRRLELDLRQKDLKFAAGSMYWIRGFLLQGLRALNLSDLDFEPEDGQVNATTAHALERLIGLVTVEAGCTLAERSAFPPTPADGLEWQRFEIGHDVPPRLRVVPFYLPQFHPIPENDLWWGEGFTEWTNVKAAKPVYLGHDQPKLPADQAFYDLRDPETVARQAALASAAGVEGFMYYHYWFAGKQLLEQPILDRLAGDVKLPFCLMWANENWTRRWDGRESDILIGQNYDDVPASRFIEDVMPILRDDRYMRIDGRAVLAVYRPGQIPDLPAVIVSWREAARRAGLGELFVMVVDVAKQFHGIDKDPPRFGLDGALGFPPHNALWEWVADAPAGTRRGFSGRILSYRAMANDAIRKLESGLPEDYFPGVMVNFDNTARRQSNPDIWYGSNPYTFRRWLTAAAAAVAGRASDRRMVFVNAWNEWAEGAVLEPSARFGSTYLLAVRDVNIR